MISITPQGIVYICKTPLESDNKNQLTFANKEAQYTYFNSKVVYAFNDQQYTYIKKDSSITIGKPIDELIGCNYLFYRNVGFTNKIYYCYIKSMEYVNENSTRVYFITDVFQTYQFDIIYNETFVEREHVNNDTIGLHTIPEGLETGDYVTQPQTESPLAFSNLAYLNTCYVIVATTGLGSNYAQPSYVGGRRFNGVYSGLDYFCFRYLDSADKFVRACQSMSSNSNDLIVTIFMAPSNLCNVSAGDFDTWTLEGYEIDMAVINPNDAEIDMGDFYINRDSYLDQNYTPRNKKLLTYPYRYILLSNNAGTVNEYKYEMFEDVENCKFNIRGAITPGCSIKLFPKNYKEGIKINGIEGFKLPTCPYTNDPYINWLTQNAINLKLDRIKNVGSIIVGGATLLATGGAGALIGGGLIASGVSGIFDRMKALQEHSLAPETAKGGENVGDLNFAMKNTFSIFKMSIKKEYAEMIDKYFDMFGYKVNMVKIPNITGRTYYNYVKTIDCNFDGDIPQEYLREIRTMFDSGITLWHDPTKIYDYSVNNSIVSS